MDFFETSPGTVVALSSPGVPIALYLENWGGYSEFNSIITSFGVQTAEGVQYLHTLRDLIYVYVFGPRMAPLHISGLSFALQCENLMSLLGMAGHGLEYAIAYYLFNRVSSTGVPVQIVLGGNTPFFGFLDGAEFHLA